MPTDSSAKGFEFSSMGIGSVLKLHRLRVPPYQREYAWETEDVVQLYTDFSNAKSANKDYFLGTIVTIGSGTNKQLEIVDGQQRLTSTAILICAIRNYLARLQSASIIVESINNEFLSIIDRSAGKRVPRLTLNIDDNAFFESLCAENADPKVLVPTRESHRLLIKAFYEAKKWVERIAVTFAETDRPARLNDWVEFIEDNATVVLLQAQNASQAFKMFETLNDRGMKTNQADLVKSYLFGQAGDRIAEAISRWSSMRDNLEEIDDDDRVINFLRHALIATRKFVRAEDIYETTQTDIRGETNSVAFLADLERLSRVYVSTYRADSEFWSTYPDAVKKALRVINKFDIKPVRPLILAMALKQQTVFSSDAFQLIVSIIVRLLVASATRSGTNEQTFAATALSVFKDELTTLKALKAALDKVTVSDADFRDSFSNARSSKADFARYYLRSLEAAIATETEPWYMANDDHDDINLEHVLPKNRKAGTWSKFSDEDVDRYLKRLGNLCLLQNSSNSAQNNDDFSNKTEVFKLAPYKFTSMIAGYTEWSPANIEARQKFMADWAVKAWPI